LLSLALGYLRLGWAMFPIRAGEKSPGTRHGCRDATRDAQRITTWWTDRPFASIGLACGPASGVLALDVDGAHGAASLAALEAEHGALPETARQRTPRGGTHYLFQHVPGVRCSAGRLGAGLDVRSEGGYIVVAPSVLVLDGRPVRYTWERDPFSTPVAEAPDWLRRLMTAPPRSAPRQPNGPTLPRAGEPIPEGKRNDTLFREACRLRRRGLDRDAILRRLVGLNARRCTPPMPETELASIAQSAARYEVGEDWMEKNAVLYRELRDRPLPA
jgi:hypothetical protein